MRRLEQAIQDLRLSQRAPGFQYVIVDAGSTLARLCGGYAKLSFRAMAPDTTMMAYSMSKPVTAVAVLQLIERGSISLEDSISRYVPWQPYGDDVTVRRLLSHTGGLPNPVPLRWVHPADEHSAFDENSAFRSVLAEHGKLAAHPGTRFIYSNIGYWLLGALVERVTGESFPSYVTNHLLIPLGLESEEMGYAVVDASGHATGYLERLSLLNLVKPLLIDSQLIDGTVGLWTAIRPHYVNGAAFGGIVGTACAFGRFLQDQLRDRSELLGRGTRDCLVQQQRTSRGPIPMTLGWHIGQSKRRRYFFKEGGGGGFRSMMRLYTDDGIGTVLMVNATTLNVGRVLDRLDSQFLSPAGC